MIMVVATTFPKFKFSLNSLNFITDNKYYQLFSLKWQAHFNFLRKISAKHTSLNNHSLLSFFQVKKWCLWKKQLVQLTTQTTAQVLLLDTISMLWYAAEVTLYILTISDFNIINIINIFTSSSRTFSSETSTFKLNFEVNFSCKCMVINPKHEKCENYTRARHKCLKTSDEEKVFRTSLVMQWLGIRLPMQGTRVRAPVREDPTCQGATKPLRHNYWACALEPESHNYWSPRA